MKKRLKLVLFMILGLVLVLAGCGQGDSDDSAGTGDADGKKKLKVVTNADFKPMEYREKGQVVGFDVDLIKAVAAEAGYDVEVKHTGWEAMFTELENGMADLAIAAITITDERKETYDFSVPYYEAVNKILVKEDSDVKSGEDLKGKIIAVQVETTGQYAAESILGENSPNIKKMEDINLAIQELLKNGADAVIADNAGVDAYIKNNPGKKLKVIPEESFESEYYGIAFPKGSALKAEFDEALNKIFDNGTYAKIYKEWFGQEPDIEHLKSMQ